MEAKAADDRFFTPRSSARRGYSSTGSEDERFASPRETARSASSDDNEYGTPREPPSTIKQEHLRPPTPSSSYREDKQHRYDVPAYPIKESKKTQPPAPQAQAYYGSRRKEIEAAYVDQDDENQRSGLAIPENDIFSAARHNRIDSVTYMLDQGVSVNSKDAYGNTILSIACQNGLKRMAKLALRRGANINSQNFRGNTPLHFCFAYGYGDTLGEYLISKGADTTITNNEGYACYYGIDPPSTQRAVSPSRK